MRRMAMILIAMAMLATACSDDSPASETIGFGSESGSGSGAQYSTFIRDSYLEGCGTEQNRAFCECTLTELELIFSETEFIRFAIESTEEMPDEALEIAFACIDEMEFGLTDTTEASSAVSSRMISVFDLRVGDCFDDQTLEVEQTEVPLVDCSLPHDNELYSEYAMTDLAFPGGDAVLESSLLQCVTEFDAFVGLA